MIDLDKIEALARAATPGPWEVQVDERPHHRGGAHIERRIRTSWEHGQLKAPYPVITTSVGIGVAAGGPAHYMVSLGEHDAAHIAAANPATVLELIALARQADTIHIPVLTDAELIARFPLPGAPVQRITLSHGAYVERETKTTGEPGWLLCAPDGTAVRGLNAYEAEFIDSALRAASEPAQPVQQPAPVAKAATPTQTGMQSLEWDAVNSAANTANNNFGQWMPERWLQEFVKAYNASIPVQPVQQPAPVAVPAELVESICHMARGYGNSETFRPQFESKLRYFWPAASVHDKQEQEYIGIRLRRVAKVAGVTVDYGDDADYYAGAFSILGDIARALDAPAASVQPFQQRVQPWMMACFGAEISADTKERNHRFFEESTELVQAYGMTPSEAHQLVDYVYGRPVGEPAQEVGGVMVTLAALCLANGLDMDAAAEAELARIWTKVEAIRAKQAAKPKHSPLPQAVQPTSGRDAALLEQAAQACDQQADGTNGPYRTACLQCADAVRELRDAAISADDRPAAATNQETPP